MNGGSRARLHGSEVTQVGLTAQQRMPRRRIGGGRGRRRTASLDQEHTGFRVLGQPRGKHRPGVPGADDDEVVRVFPL